MRMRERSSVERIRMALTEKRDILGDILGDIIAVEREEFSKEKERRVGEKRGEERRGEEKKKEERRGINGGTMVSVFCSKSRESWRSVES